MKFINGVENLTEEHCGSVVTIGNYDGVHCGHQHVIGGLIKEARARSLKATVITFEPLAREYFSPSEPVGRLTSIEERAELLFELGVEQVGNLDLFGHIGCLARPGNNFRRKCRTFCASCGLAARSIAAL